jgi:hypothetical protein
MKKQMKKLVLAKETVGRLSPVESRNLAGGTLVTPPTIQCWSNPDYSCQDEFATGKGCES